MITGRTALYGVIGHPVAHSRSPEVHAAFGAATGEDIPTLIRAFMEAPGVPLVTVTPEGGERTPEVRDIG